MSVSVDIKCDLMSTQIHMKSRSRPRPRTTRSPFTPGSVQWAVATSATYPLNGSQTNVPAIIDKILRIGEGKILRQLETIAKAINAIEDDFVAMSDDELRGMTDEFRKRLADGETLDDLMPEAFATVREAAKRVLGQRHFDVQLMGGAALHLGNIAEMKTGEGKTLVSTLPSYLNALDGKGVHVVTVNDYLAKYHAEWMGRVHHFLGLTTDVILPNMSRAA